MVLAGLVVVGVLTVTVVLGNLAVVLTGIHLGLDVHFNEVVHGDNVVGAAAGGGAVGRAKLEVNKLLLLLSLPVVAVLLITTLEGKVLVGDGTPLEDDGVLGDPVTSFGIVLVLLLVIILLLVIVVIVVVVVLETTGLGHDVSTKLGADGDIIHGDFDRLAGGDSGGSGEDGGGTEEHGCWLV